MNLMKINNLKLGVSPIVEMLRLKASLSTLWVTYLGFRRYTLINLTSGLNFTKYKRLNVPKSTRLKESVHRQTFLHLLISEMHVWWCLHYDKKNWFFNIITGSSFRYSYVNSESITYLIMYEPSRRLRMPSKKRKYLFLWKQLCNTTPMLFKWLYRLGMYELENYMKSCSTQFVAANFKLTCCNLMWLNGIQLAKHWMCFLMFIVKCTNVCECAQWNKVLLSTKNIIELETTN